MPWLVAWFVSVAVSLLVTPLVTRIALAFGAVDQPHSRKIHRSVTPRLGGLGVVAGVSAACAVALPFLADSTVLGRGVREVILLGVSGLAIAGLGIYDDLRGANARTKLAVQIAVALLLYAGGFRLDRVDLLLGSPIALGMLSLPVTVLWIVGMSNALNLVDGLDGLAGGIALAAAAAFFLIASGSGDAVGMLVALALMGSLLGFLVYNVNPASVFMGDTGSLFLGTVLAALAIRHGEGTSVPLGAIVIVFGIPIVDTLGAMARRTLRGTPVFCADREHLHHRLLAAGLSQRNAVLVLWLGGALLAVTGVHAVWGLVPGPATLAVWSACAVLAVTALALPEGWSPFERIRRRRNRERLAAVRTAAQRLREAASVHNINELLAWIAPRLDAQAVQLRGTASLPPASRAEHAEQSRARTLLCLDPHCPDSGTLEVVWARTPRQERDAEIALELLGEHVAASLRRIGERPTRSPALGSSRQDGALWRRSTEMLGVGATAGPEECVRSVLRWIEQGDHCRWLACMNLNAYSVARTDGGFAQALRHADWLIPDGAAIALASRLMRPDAQQRITGRDVFFGVNAELERRGGGTVFYLGPDDQHLARIRARMQRDFPRVRVAGFHPRPRLGAGSELEEAVALVNEVRPDVLWVGMTAPRQERWLHANKGRLEVKFAAAIGAVLDSYGGHRSPLVQRLGLEWLPRLLREPRRAWRAACSAPVFLWDLLTAAAVPDRPAAELPLLLTPPPLKQQRLEQRAAARASAAVGGASAQHSPEAHP